MRFPKQSLTFAAVALGAVSAAGGGVPSIAAHSISFERASCAMISPKPICAGVGLKPYLPAGISSAAATRLVSARLAVERRASDTGAAPCAATVAARQQIASGMS